MRFWCFFSSLCYDVSVRLSVTEVDWVAMHARNTAAAPASEAIIRSPTNMAAADVAAVEGAMLATARPSCLCFYCIL